MVGRPRTPPSPAGPLFCQVKDCAVPLHGLKEYHQRYKVCEEHLKIPFIVRDDGQQVRGWVRGVGEGAASLPPR